MTYKLRDYQQEASDAAVNFFNDGQKYNGLIVAPTGCGKSLIIADIANRLDDNTSKCEYSTRRKYRVSRLP